MKSGRTLWAVWTAVTAAVLLVLIASPAAAEEEEASCHGAYDLYFVLDK